MSNTIVNAAPMVRDLGTQDLSTRRLPREPESIPQHLPKFYIFAERGPTTEELLVGNERVNMYGAETFNIRGKYANHATVLSNLVNAEGNSAMYKRLVPADAGPESNLLLSLDVLETTVDIYARNTDGSIRVNNLGDPIITGTAPGYKVKWVATYYQTLADAATFGQATISNGSQYAADGTRSQRYPIFQWMVNGRGKYGDNIGVRIWAPTLKTQVSMPTRMMNSEYAYPYYISVIEKSDKLATPQIKETLMAEQTLSFTTKVNTIDPSTDNSLYLDEIFIDSYQNLTNLRYPKQFGDFGKLHVYQNNIDTLVLKFQTAEIPYIDDKTDFSEDPAQAHLFNYISGVNSSGIAYNTFVFVNDSDSVRLSQFTNVYCGGGSDGTMNDTIFANMVSAEVARYLNSQDPIQERAVHVESILYDTGFPLETKLDLASFISLRRDTYVVMGTHTVGEAPLDSAEEYSAAIALRTALQMYPESDYFGTPVMRGMIVGRSGKLLNSQFTQRVPLSFEVGIKAAKYMGAGDGSWKTGKNFDGAPGSVVESMYDINITWVPESVRNRNWDVGLNWVQSYDRRSFFFPALKTVYDDDTSVLTSFITVLAICQINKVQHAAWREFSGVSNLTNAQLIDRVNAFVRSRLNGRFDGRFVIEPDTFITAMDELRGYSWTTPVKIYAANMKTLQTTYTQAFRIEDLAA